MSFYASNNRIYITNAAGKVIFDTNKPMPHIIQTITKQISVSFPNIPTTYWRDERRIAVGSAACYGQVYECRWVYGCENEWICGPQQVCGYQNVCNYNPLTGQNECGLQWVCNTQNVCGYQNICANRQKCQWWDYWGDQWRIEQGFDYAAHNWETTVEVGTITDGLDADFLLVNCTANRTAQGSIPDIGPFPCGLPLNTSFVANNSSIIEVVSDLRDGAPFMTRLMSIFVEGGKVKAHFKHTNRAFRAVSYWRDYGCSQDQWPPYVGGIPQTPPSGASSYTFNLTVQVGKFTA